ncbi:MAG: hypothetical protein RIB67_01105 [Miltoncostaeaceae bacterium]
MPGQQRVLVTVYGLFAIAAGARSGVQIGTQWSEAPLAYSLSALAAVVYLVAAVAFANPGAVGDRVAVIAVLFELAGVLAVGTWSLVDADRFPDATVWSGYGIGYGFVPLVLPLVGLAWLRWGRRRE